MIQFWECIESLMLRFRFSIKTKEVYRNSILVFNRVDKWAGRYGQFTIYFYILLVFVERKQKIVGVNRNKCVIDHTWELQALSTHISNAQFYLLVFLYVHPMN